MSTTLAHISVNLSTSGGPRDWFWRKPRSSYPQRRVKVASLHRNGLKSNWVLVGDERLKTKKKRVVLVRGFGFNGGGGEKGISGRILGNLALAVGLTYLSATGQIDWLFDAIGWVINTVVSISIFAILLPILGLGAFLWWAGRDMVQGSCPNCGNEFQILKSTLNDEVQLCPYCTQPFSVENDRFVRDPVMFSNESPFGDILNGFSPPSKKGTKSSGVVDVEAEVRDAD